MNQFSEDIRRRAAREELDLLLREELISPHVYQEIIQAQEQYHIKALQKEQERIQLLAEKRKVEEVAKKQEIKKKTLSPQKVRERNITWLLNLGVILLLVGGLVLATSAWDILADWVKTGLIGLVSLLFFGLAFITTRVLKITKTAFAFYVLGSLFLPIIVLSAGFFELFGPYFSFHGEGRFLYGAIGSIFIIPVFIILSYHLSSRLFVWFTYITLTSIAGFLIAALYLPVDGFYLGIMLFNGALITLYLYFKDNKKYKQFTTEFIPFIQANLILSTLLMLVFYQSEVMYSVNLFLTAAIYFAMIFVTKHKEYHFVFTAMLVYGAYQLIEFSVVNQVDGIAYALLGFIFLALPKFVPNETSLKRVFQYTSAFISGAAFLYITFEGILLRMYEPSLVLFIAYLIISLNFIFLAHSVKQILFKYLSPIFLIAASAELAFLSEKWFDSASFAVTLFMCAFVLYIGIGCFMKLSFFKVIKESTRDIAFAVMALCIIFGWLTISFWQVGMLFILLSGIALFMDHFEDRLAYKANSIASWIHAISAGLAVLFLYGAVDGKVYTFEESLPFEVEHVIAASIVVLLVSYLWRHFNRKDFYDHAFFISIGFYAIGVLMALGPGVNDFLRPVIMLGGIGMAYLLYKRLGKAGLSYAVSGMSLTFYLMLLNLLQTQFNIQSNLYNELQFTFGAVLLLAIGLIIGRKDLPLRNSFWWIGHLYLPLILIISLLVWEDSLITYLIATAIYGLSLMYVYKEWKTKLLLYASFTSLFLSIWLFMDKINLGEEIHYAFLITSGLVSILWIVSKEPWVKRIAYYVVPFSVVGLSSFSLASPFDLMQLFIMLLYTAGLLYIMHKQKWAIYNIIPLLIIFNALIMFGVENLTNHKSMVLLITSFAFGAFLLGFIIHRLLYYDIEDKTDIIVIDWYTIMGFIASFYLYTYMSEDLWVKLIPGILISGGILLQQERIPRIAAKWFVFAASVYLLQPYYALLQHVNIPELIERELYVLPWIIFVVFLKKIINQQHKAIMNYVEWAVLVIIALILVQDAMVSDTVYEAVILGGLALISLLFGMFNQRKSFFFVGTGVLLLNVLLQTRSYWGNLPWWAYLLIAGSILIGVASYNEWHKQKVSDGKETLVSKFNKRVIAKIKKWE